MDVAFTQSNSTFILLKRLNNHEDGTMMLQKIKNKYFVVGKNNNNFTDVYYVPDTILGTWHVLTYLIFITTLQDNTIIIHIW